MWLMVVSPDSTRFTTCPRSGSLSCRPYRISERVLGSTLLSVASFRARRFRLASSVGDSCLRGDALPCFVMVLILSSDGLRSRAGVGVQAQVGPLLFDEVTNCNLAQKFAFVINLFDFRERLLCEQ